MKSLLVISAVVLASLPLPAEERVDREKDGLKGRVRAVQSVTQRFAEEGPSHRSLMVAPACARCEYDAAGNRTLIDDGNSVARRVFDSDGRLAKENWFDRSGKLTKQIVLEYGPHGIERIATYRGKNLEAATRFMYNAQGFLASVSRLDGNGKVLIHSEHSRDAQGRLTGWRTVNENGEVTSHVAQRVGERGVEEVGSFGADGSPRLHLVADGGNIRYWQKAGDEPTYGSIVPLEEPRKRTTRTYLPGGKYESTVAEFADDEKLLPDQMARFDADGNLVERLSIEYELDWAGNWTQRRVQACTAAGECQLVQQDRRTLTYHD